MHEHGSAWILGESVLKNWISQPFFELLAWIQAFPVHKPQHIYIYTNPRTSQKCHCHGDSDKHPRSKWYTKWSSSWRFKANGTHTHTHIHTRLIRIPPIFSRFPLAVCRSYRMVWYRNHTTIQDHVYSIFLIANFCSPSHKDFASRLLIWRSKKKSSYIADTIFSLFPTYVSPSFPPKPVWKCAERHAWWSSSILVWHEDCLSQAYQGFGDRSHRRVEFPHGSRARFWKWIEDGSSGNIKSLGVLACCIFFLDPFSSQMICKNLVFN